MKYAVLTILVTMMISASTWAAESESFQLQNHDMVTYLLEEAISQPRFTRPSYRTFKTEIWYLKFLECFSKMEYGIERETCFPGYGILPRKQAIVTRFQLFKKPIYLTFSISQ